MRHVDICGTKQFCIESMNPAFSYISISIFNFSNPLYHKYTYFIRVPKIICKFIMIDIWYKYRMNMWRLLKKRPISKAVWFVLDSWIIWTDKKQTAPLRLALHIWLWRNFTLPRINQIFISCLWSICIQSTVRLT